MGIIVAGPGKALSHISFLHLVEVAPARYLLALDSGYDFNKFEIALTDVLDDVPLADRREQGIDDAIAPAHQAAAQIRDDEPRRNNFWKPSA